MKMFRTGLVCVVFLSMMSTACAQVGKVTVIATDFETGDPIEEATVFAGFVQVHGMEAGSSNHYECVTDSKGKCAIWGHGNGGSVAVGVMTNEYYYGAVENLEFKGSFSPIARPWNPVVELRLKAIRNPIPMYAKNLSQERFPEAVAPKGYDPKNGWLEMSADSGTVSYDLEKGGWVEPHGQGKIADLVFNIKREARVEYTENISPWHRKSLSSGATIEITVSNDGDGFIPYPVAEKDRHRGLRLPHEAPLEGYVPVVKKYKIRSPNERTRSNIEEDMNYFFRVRTRMDETGRVISALYGKIYRDFTFGSLGTYIDFAYYLNPTPNDRNVEFKPGSNLLTDLKGTQDPYEP